MIKKLPPLWKIQRYEAVWIEDEYLRRVLKKGKLWPVSGLLLRAGEPNSCHLNSSKLFAKSPRTYRIVTGFYLDNREERPIWRPHTWLWDLKRKRIVETIIPATHYFGILLDKDESNFFAWNEAALKNLPPKAVRFKGALYLLYERKQTCQR